MKKLIALAAIAAVLALSTPAYAQEDEEARGSHPVVKTSSSVDAPIHTGNPDRFPKKKKAD